MFGNLKITGGNIQIGNGGRMINSSGGNFVGNNSTFIGNNNTITGNNNKIIGNNNTITGNRNTILGDQNRIVGNKNNADGMQNSFVGNNNQSVINDQNQMEQDHMDQVNTDQVQTFNGAVFEEGSMNQFGPGEGKFNFNGSVMENCQIGSGSIMRVVGAQRYIPKKENKPKRFSKQEKVDDEVIQCNICMENKKNAVLKPCGHTFCYGCVKELKRCPNCRKDVKTVDPLYI